MLVLVTGATGLVGNNVVRLLLDRGDQVRVLARMTSDPRPLADLNVEIIQGDLQQQDALKQAAEGVDLVIHAAAQISFGWTGIEQARAINVEGSRNVAKAAQANGAKMVHVSSVDTLSPGSWEQPADEETVGKKIPCTYVVSKREAEAAIRQQIDQGLNAVIVNPGFMLGPWDWKPSSGRMLIEVAKRFTPLAPSGGLSVCDVRDVANGILAAAEKGTTGRNYILAGHNLTYFDAWNLFAKVAGGKGPAAKMGPLIRNLAGAAGDLWTKLTGREGDVNSAGIKMSSLVHYYSSARAEAELNYYCRPAEQSVEDAWKWFIEHGYV